MIQTRGTASLSTKANIELEVKIDEKTTPRLTGATCSTDDGCIKALYNAASRCRLLFCSALHEGEMASLPPAKNSFFNRFFYFFFSQRQLE